MSRLRLIFMGTPDFAVPTLQALLDAGHEVLATYTQPPRPAGRGQKARLSPVHELAQRQDIEVRTPASLKGEAVQQAFVALEADAAVVVAYGLILPAAILAASRLGCLNLHASLLPRWRGAAPIQRAIMAGDGMSGVTAMMIDTGLDTGPVLLQEKVAIGPDMTAGELHDRLASMGGPIMCRALEGLDAGTLVAEPQGGDGVTYAQKIAKDEGRLDWSRPAVELACLVRALAPAPGAWFTFNGQRIKVQEAKAVDGRGRAGEVLDGPLTVVCGDGALALRRLQRAGKAPMVAADFLRGFAIPAGSRLD